MTYSLSADEASLIRTLIQTILNDEWSDKPLDTQDLVDQARIINLFLR